MHSEPHRFGHHVPRSHCQHLRRGACDQSRPHCGLELGRRGTSKRLSRLPIASQPVSRQARTDGQTAGPYTRYRIGRRPVLGSAENRHQTAAAVGTV